MNARPQKQVNPGKEGKLFNVATEISVVLQKMSSVG
jgi:hypothetical protein